MLGSIDAQVSAETGQNTNARESETCTQRERIKTWSDEALSAPRSSRLSIARIWGTDDPMCSYSSDFEIKIDKVTVIGVCCRVRNSRCCASEG